MTVTPDTPVTGNPGPVPEAPSSNLPPVSNLNVNTGPLGVPGALFTVKISTVAALIAAAPTAFIRNISPT